MLGMRGIWYWLPAYLIVLAFWSPVAHVDLSVLSAGEGVSSGRSITSGPGHRHCWESSFTKAVLGRGG